MKLILTKTRRQMKKIDIIMIMLIASFAFMGCEKNAGSLSELSNKKTGIKSNDIFEDGTEHGFYVNLNPAVPFEDISIGDYGMLHFENMESFKQTKSELERMTEEWMMAYYEEFDELSTVEMLLLKDSTGYTDAEIYKYFESAMEFNSLRAMIAEEEFEYLQLQYASIEDDPDNHFIFEESVRTLLNEYEEVSIGDTLYKFYEGFYLAIPSEHSDRIPDFRVGDDEAWNLAGQIDVVAIGYGGQGSSGSSVGSGGSSNCDTRINVSDRGYEPEDADEARIKWVVSFYNHPWDDTPRVAVKTKYQEYNDVLWGMGYWHKVSKYAIAKLVAGSELTNKDDCSKISLPEEWTDFPGGGKAKLKVFAPDDTIKYEVESEDINGYHSAGGIEYESTLTF